MSLSNDLISQFVKMTNDTGKKETKDTTLYGTVVEYDGNNYVRLDGSDLLTPVDTTSTLHVDDRVTVDITKHNATVSGNISNPSVSGVEIKQSEENLIIYFDEQIENVLLIFKDGYYEGITTVNAEGVQVSHTAYEGYTKMSYDGFYINDGTEDVFTATAEGLTVKGKITGSQIEGSDIKGSTFSSENDVFQVLSDGTVETNYLSVNGTVSTEVLDVGHIYNPKYPSALTYNTTVYIDSAQSNSINDYRYFSNGAIFSSFDDMMDIMPGNLNGYTLHIYMNSDVTENVIINKFYGGEVYIHMQGHTINGYLKMYNQSAMFRVYGNKSSSTGGSTHGKIMPYSGAGHYGYYYCVSCSYGMFYIFDVDVYPTTSQGSNTGGLYFGGGSRGYVSGIHLMGGSGGMRYAVRLYESSTVYIHGSSGVGNNAVFCANHGSVLTLNATTQAGTTGTSATYTDDNSIIRSDGVTFATASNDGSNTGSGSTSTTTTKTISATSADTYRSTVYNSWKGDGTVRQGDWGYGDCQGCWFFGSALYNAMNAGTPTKVVIKITRQSGGYNAAQTHTLKLHNYKTKPSGAPSYSGTLTTFSCAVGSTATITITDSTMLSLLRNCYGLGLSIGSTSSPYSVCSGSCSVTVTYTT